MEPTKTELDYKDYVIKDGKLVGAFEEMYQKVDNPWGQMSMQYILDSRRILAQAWCNKLKMQGKDAESREMASKALRLQGSLTRAKPV